MRCCTCDGREVPVTLNSKVTESDPRCVVLSSRGSVVSSVPHCSTCRNTDRDVTAGKSVFGPPNPNALVSQNLCTSRTMPSPTRTHCDGDQPHVYLSLSLKTHTHIQCKVQLCECISCTCATSHGALRQGLAGTAATGSHTMSIQQYAECVIQLHHRCDLRWS